LPKLKIAHIIGKAVWEQRGDIRDVISIGKLVRKNDGPEDVEQIVSTIDHPVCIKILVFLLITWKFI
jgi:hypothetical protein